MDKPPVRRALVADDEPMIGTLVKEILQREGFACDLTVDGDDAARRLSGGGYQLAVLDLHMPGRGGAEILESHRREGGSVPGILMSSFLTDEVLARYGSLASLAFLHKPFGLADLLLATRRVCPPA